MNDQGISLSTAPTWAIFAGDLGRGLVIAGVLAFLGSVIFAAFNVKKVANILFVAGSATLIGTFLCLAALFVQNQFEYQYVYEHADAITELKYKIAGVWSGQQGSFLLWACASAIFGVLALRSTGIYQRWYVAVYGLFLASLCGILAYETPFKLLEGVMHNGHVLVPQTGAGLNASLQNYWVVIHPPTIFTGFGSLTVLFCFAVSAMMTGNLIDWARLVRPWALLSIAILGLGISMGGLWAYETLGWGGFWAWDPVENTSFVPWLLTVAFVHGLIVMVTKGKWIASTLLLGGLPFVSFVYGTFLTRSGFLANASVHSFAEMNRSALWILLGMLIIAATGFFVLWLVKGGWKSKTTTAEARAVSRESFYKVGVTFLCLFSLAVAIGMSVPFFMSIANKPSKVVPEGLYHLVVAWFFVPIILLTAIGPFVSWRQLSSGSFWGRIFNVFCVTIGLTGVALLIFKMPRIGVNIDPAGRVALPFGHSMPLALWMGVLTFLCIFTLVGNLWRIGELSKHSNVFSWGGFISHIGVAVLMAGLIMSRGFERKEQVVAQRGESVVALGYVLTPGNWEGTSMSDRNAKLPVQITNPEGVKFTATPGLYWLDGPDGKQQTMRWPYIYHAFSHDMYLALGDPITTVWESPILMEPGRVVNASDMFSLKYNGFKMVGQPGQTGTRFVADLDITAQGKTYHPKPGLTMTPNGLQDELADGGPQFYVTMSSIDAATKSASLQVYFKQPIYPMELYYKPMTSLVWGGTGILFLGGLMAAFYRRPRPSPEDTDGEDAPAVEKEESKEDALVSAP